jgi:hypothetical protein
MILIVQEGAAWVMGQDGTRETVEARTVVIYEAGDRIEYASDGSGEAFAAELYGAAAFSEEQADARLARFLNSELRQETDHQR